MCDIAAQRDLQLNVTFLTGRMSGPSWGSRVDVALRPDLPVPPGVRQVTTAGRAVECGDVRPYADPAILQSEELLLRTVSISRTSRPRQTRESGCWPGGPMTRTRLPSDRHPPGGGPAEARTTMENDPAVKNGVMQSDLHPYRNPIQGRL